MLPPISSFFPRNEAQRGKLAYFPGPSSWELSTREEHDSTLMVAVGPTVVACMYLRSWGCLGLMEVFFLRATV